MFKKIKIPFHILLSIHFVYAASSLSLHDKSYMMQQVCKQYAKNYSCSCTESKVAPPDKYSNFDININSALIGHFTTKNKIEAIILTDGCEPYAYNWGGYLVYEKTKGKWKFKRYYRGKLGDCKKIHTSDNRDKLICNSSFTAQGYREEDLYLATLTKNGIKKIKSLYRGSDDTFTGIQNPTNTTIDKWWIKNNRVIFLVNNKKRAITLDVEHDRTKHIAMSKNSNYTVLKKPTQTIYKIVSTDSCEIFFNTHKKLISHNCKRLTNSKGIQIFCTPSKKVCKTYEEILQSINENSK
jgi:hypothetical protein